MKMYLKTIQDMEAVLSQHAWIVSDDFSLADIAGFRAKMGVIIPLII